MAHKHFDYEKIVNEFYQLEKKHELFNLKEKNVYIWKLIRFYVFLKILNEKQGIKEIHLQVGESKKVKSIFSKLVNSFIKNPFMKKKKNILVIDHPRKVKYKKHEFDPYTNYFLEKMNKSEYELLERRYVGKYNKSIHSTNSTMDFFAILNNINKKIKNINISDETNNALEKLQEEIHNQFNVKIDIKKLAYEKLLDFISLRQIFGYYISKKRPKKLYLVVSYVLDPYVAAAQDYGVKVIEFQHGVMGPFHVGYHFPYQEIIPYFPDEIKMFGPFWDEITALPKTTIKTFDGYPYLKNNIYKYREIIKNDKNDKEIIVISQGTIGRALSEITYELVKKLPDYTFKYKLHPGEFGRWKKEYPLLVELSNFSNVQVIEDKENLYDLFSIATFVLGVNSTAIFEAIAFKVEPIILKLPSYETMKFLNRLYDVPMLKTSDEVKEYIVDHAANNKKLTVDVDLIFKGLYDN